MSGCDHFAPTHRTRQCLTVPSSTGSTADLIGRYLSRETSEDETILVRRWLMAHPEAADAAQSIPRAAGRRSRSSARAERRCGVERAAGARPRARGRGATAGRRAARHAHRSGPPPFAPRPGGVAPALSPPRVSCSPLRSRYAALVDRVPDARPSTTDRNTYVTGAGERSDLLLADGTRVRLAPGSQVRVAADFGIGAARRLPRWRRLLRGDARRVASVHGVRREYERARHRHRVLRAQLRGGQRGAGRRARGRGRRRRRRPTARRRHGPRLRAPAKRRCAAPSTSSRISPGRRGDSSTTTRHSATCSTTSIAGTAPTCSSPTRRARISHSPARSRTSRPTRRWRRSPPRWASSSRSTASTSSSGADPRKAPRTP